MDSYSRGGLFYFAWYRNGNHSFSLDRSATLSPEGHPVSTHLTVHYPDGSQDTVPVTVTLVPMQSMLTPPRIEELEVVTGGPSRTTAPVVGALPGDTVLSLPRSKAFVALETAGWWPGNSASTRDGHRHGAVSPAR